MSSLLIVQGAFHGHKLLCSGSWSALLNNLTVDLTLAFVFISAKSSLSFFCMLKSKVYWSL